MSSIMGEVIFHSTVEEYKDKVKQRAYVPKPINFGSDTDDWVMTSTTQTTTNTNPDSDLPTSDYDLRGVGGENYGNYYGNYDVSYDAYGNELPKGVGEEFPEDVDDPKVIVEENDEGEEDLPNDWKPMYEESQDADLPKLNYDDLGDYFGNYELIYGSYRKRRSTADSTASRREKCLRDYWEDGDERCVCSMIPADFFFEAQYMECRLDQESVQRCNFWLHDNTI